MDELPVLIATFESEEQARELEAAARVGRHVWVALKWGPAEPGPHLLEVYVPTSNDPLRLLAEPLGTESERGFALRVYPWEEEAPEEETPFAGEVEVAHDPMIGRSLAKGRFEILSTIGEGSIGAVYRARHTGLGITVAVKVLHEAFQRDGAFTQRFYAEALALSRLDHPNLVHIYDFGQEEDGLLYISMAFVDGTTLRALAGQDHSGSPSPALETKRMVPLMLQVCAGLGHAHARGLIHRDVKPDNVMVVRREDDDGNIVETVKVLDFGFAVPPSVSGEVAQRLAGTPVYMSPEQCLGEELDARSDVYACGIMLYELATGTVPFLGRSSESIRRKQIEMPAPWIRATHPDVDPRLDRLVQRALAKRREERHPNMQELRAELKTLLVPAAPAHLSVGSLPVARPAPAPIPPTAEESSRDLLASVAAGLLAGQEAAGPEGVAILAEAGVPGAYALYGARTKMAADQRTRVAFITTMKSLGGHALPVVRAALERILEPTLAGDHPGAAELAEDLLLALPPGDDEVTGHLVLKYAAAGAPSVCRAAARALPRVWGRRAYPTLVALLEHGDDGVRIAAIVGLREIGAVEEAVIARLAALHAGGFLATNQLRAAALGALSDAAPDARPHASALIARLSV